MIMNVTPRNQGEMAMVGIGTCGLWAGGARSELVHRRPAQYSAVQGSVKLT